MHPYVCLGRGPLRGSRSRCPCRVRQPHAPGGSSYLRTPIERGGNWKYVDQVDNATGCGNWTLQIFRRPKPAEVSLGGISPRFLPPKPAEVSLGGTSPRLLIPKVCGGVSRRDLIKVFTPKACGGISRRDLTKVIDPQSLRRFLSEGPRQAY